MTDMKEVSSAQGVRDDRGLPVDRIVFGVAAALSVGFVLVGAIWPEELAENATKVLTWVTENFGWLFVLTSAGFVLFSAYLALTRYGNIKLGPDDSEPEFSTFSWVSMMFATGMGIGLMFWGVAEPLTHLNAPPLGQAEAGSADDGPGRDDAAGDDAPGDDAPRDDETPPPDPDRRPMTGSLGIGDLKGTDS